jgi:hypothetical protein
MFDQSSTFTIVYDEGWLMVHLAKKKTPLLIHSPSITEKTRLIRYQGDLKVKKEALID